MGSAVSNGSPALLSVKQARGFRTYYFLTKAVYQLSKLIRMADNIFNQTLNTPGLFIFMVLLSLIIEPFQNASADTGFKPPITTVLPDITKRDQNSRFLIELTPYFESSKTEEDSYALGFFFSADISDNLEFQFASDTITYQKPDLGVSDIMFGLRWDFFEKYLDLALIGYLELPTGSKAFAEPEAEPTLSIEASRGFGNFMASLTLGSTYLTDSEDEDYYFNYSFQIELDYCFNKSNDIGVIFSGYTPDQLDDGITRALIGLSYTRTLDQNNSVGISVLKGLSRRGMDINVAVSYDYQF
jgi:hypothetical protein